jgi:membrane protease YdiL (CAAX protease family)
MVRQRFDLSDFVKRHPALSLFLVAVAFGPALVAPVLAGWLSPKFLQLGALSASLAGFTVAAVEGGTPAVRELFRRGGIWRVGIGWWLAAVFVPLVPAVGAIHLAAAYTSEPVDASSLGPWWSVLPSMLLLILFAGLGEEFGWRGFAFPRLRARHRDVVAALIIGAFHALWHIPLFLVKGEAYNTLAQQIGFLPAFLGYACLVLALSIVLAWIFTNTRGSVLLAAVYHGAGNAWAGYVAIDRAGLAGHLAFVATHVVAAVLLVVFYGPHTLTRVRPGT